MASSFLAVISSDATWRDALLSDGLRQTFEGCLPYVPDECSEFHNQIASVFYWARADVLIRDTPLWTTGDTYCAGLFGFGIDRDSGHMIDASVVAEADSFANLWGSVDGEWSAVRVRGNRLEAGSSAVGTEHMYYTEGERFSAVSNRARLLWYLRAAAGESLRPNFHTLSQLLTLCYPFCTTDTAVEEVKLAPSTSYIHADTKQICVDELDSTYFLAPTPPDTTPDWKRLTDQFRANLTWLGTQDAPVIAALTGGKDSRLVLAGLMDSGLTEGIDHLLHSRPEKPPRHACRRAVG